MAHLLHDGSKEPPRLQVYLNLYNLSELPSGSTFPVSLHSDWAGLSARLRTDGFTGIQLTTNEPPPPGLALPYCGLDRINSPSEADPVVALHRDRGDECLTVHAGWGLEEDAEVFALVEAILAASEHHKLPVFIETHRATITQDMWRTVQIAKRFPEVRFNGDFSHYYCGQEMVYGGMEMKLAFLAPVFERIGFLHGRIASPGSMQVPIEADLAARPLQAHGEANYLEHFRSLWTHAMRGFLASAGPGDRLIFAPELLSGRYYYARLFLNSEGCLVEESDRYAQALLLANLARECFASAQRDRSH